MISVLDENGMRITQRHQNWIALGEGQELKCNGCHDANSGVSHGRYDAFESAYAGAPAGMNRSRIRIRDGLSATRRDDGRDARTRDLRQRWLFVTRAVDERDLSRCLERDPLDANGDPINPDIDYLYTDLTTHRRRRCRARRLAVELPQRHQLRVRHSPALEPAAHRHGRQRMIPVTSADSAARCQR